MWKITFDKCIVPENIHTPTEGNGNSERKAGLKSGTFQWAGGGGLGLLTQFFTRGLSKIGALFNISQLLC